MSFLGMHQAPVEAKFTQILQRKDARAQSRKKNPNPYPLVALPTKLFLAPWRLCVLALKDFPGGVAFRHDQSRKHHLEFSAFRTVVR
jgi:hypothetical protein